MRCVALYSIGVSAYKRTGMPTSNFHYCPPAFLLYKTLTSLIKTKSQSNSNILLIMKLFLSSGACAMLFLIMLGLLQLCVAAPIISSDINTNNIASPSDSSPSSPHQVPATNEEEPKLDRRINDSDNPLYSGSFDDLLEDN